MILGILGTVPQHPVSAEHLRVTFSKRTTALQDLSFDIRTGTSVALVGANGSGKTTLLDAVAGLIDPTAGSLRVDRTALAYVVQQRHQHEWLPLTVAEVVRMGRYGKRGLAGRLGADDRRAVAVATERMAISDLLSERFTTLSGGQRQRTMVAQALAQEPELLLLDEPITGLDLTSQQLILDVIAEETEAGHTVLLSTHNLDEARHCDRVFLLANRLVADGRPDEVLTPDRLRSTFGVEVLGDHRGHDHDDALLIVDEHGHGEHGHG